MHNYFLQELKDQRLLVIRHVPGGENEAGIFTKNTTGPVFKNTFVSLSEMTSAWLRTAAPTY